MIPVLALAVAASAAQRTDDAVQWSFQQPQRYAIEAKIRLPIMMWLGNRFNKQARFDVIDLRMVTACAPGEPEGRRAWQLECTLEDVAMSAEALPQEVGHVQAILTEVDARLTGAVVQLQVRDDGRLVNVDLEQVSRRNARVGFINENLRLLVSRAFAGLDLPLPRRAGDDAWVQRQSWAMQAPTRYGSYGVAELIHQVRETTPLSVTILSGGRGIIVPDEGLNKYRARYASQTVFDRTEGHIHQRTWTLAAEPTASSQIAQGTAGYPYTVEGRVVWLGETGTWDVGESLELPRTTPAMTAIQQSFIDPLR